MTIYNQKRGETMKRMKKPIPNVGEMFHLGTCLMEIVSINDGYIKLLDSRVAQIRLSVICRIDSNEFINDSNLYITNKFPTQFTDRIEYFWTFKYFNALWSIKKPRIFPSL